MKTLLTLFVLLFSSSVFTDDISDFEIEGISIGDSLLDYMTEEKIKEEGENQFKQQSDQQLLNDVTEALIEKTNFDLPAEFLQRWIMVSGEKELTEEEAKEEGCRRWCRRRREEEESCRWQWRSSQAGAQTLHAC